MRFSNNPRMLRLGIRLLSWPRTITAKLEEQLKLQACTAHPTARLFPQSVIFNARRSRDVIQIGANSWCNCEFNIFEPAGNITVGSYCYIGEFSRVRSAVGVSIGNRVLIAHSVNIHDHDGHPRSAMKRHLQEVRAFAGGGDDMTDVRMAPIVINDDVWIGFNAAVMKGVTIGKSAIIGAATVITNDVPAYAIMVGNPARQVGTAPE